MPAQEFELTDTLAAKKKRAKRYGIGAVEGKPLSKPAKYADVPDNEFGDPVNYAYPADDEHKSNVMQYFNRDDARTSGGYSEKDWSIIGRRLAEMLDGNDADKACRYDKETQRLEWKEASKKAMDSEQRTADSPDYSDDVMVALEVPATTAHSIELPHSNAVKDQHVTLIHLGGKSDLPTPPTGDAESALVQAVTEYISANPGYMRGRINGAGRFASGDEKQPFYANVDVAALPAFRQGLVEHLQAQGFVSRSEHGFTPHITLAYLDKDEKTPDAHLPNASVTFANVIVGWGDKKTRIPVKYTSPSPQATKAGKRLAADKLAVISALRTDLQAILPRIDAIINWANYTDTDQMMGVTTGVNIASGKALGEQNISLILRDTNDAAIKIIEERADKVLVGGYMIHWGSPEHRDLHGDFFTPQTELFLDHYKAAPALFQHGTDSVIGRSVIGHRKSARKDDKGLWVEDWINKSNQYWNMIAKLLKDKRLFYSPGSVPHLVTRTDKRELKAFPIVDDTLTPTPSQFCLGPVEHIRQITAIYKAAGLDFSLPDKLLREGAGEAPTSSSTGDVSTDRALALLRLKKLRMML